MIVVIESVSLVIRPLTLTLRLTINMIAGHLLLVLVRGLHERAVSFIQPVLIRLKVVLTLFEMCIRMIQSFVYAMLITLYTRE